MSYLPLSPANFALGYAGKVDDVTVKALAKTGSC